jgi:hypothetical protein
LHNETTNQQTGSLFSLPELGRGLPIQARLANPTEDCEPEGQQVPDLNESKVAGFSRGEKDWVMPGKPRRYVLLVLTEEHIEPRLLSSASGLCRRMDAGLDIMLSSSEKQPPPLLENFMRRLQQDGIHYRLTQQAMLRSKEIVQYANTHECISTVMIDSLGRWTTPEDEKGSDPWRKLDCPLVVAMPD